MKKPDITEEEWKLIIGALIAAKKFIGRLSADKKNNVGKNGVEAYKKIKKVLKNAGCE